MTNRLVTATSPYLLQHKDNPVDWFEWGDEALAAARTLDRPILLSIGYSACHWCHVMAHESFEHAATAAYMNEHFVNIKVDREERPDIDRIYMDALQAMTGHGGWPLTAFLTPTGEPFYAGTYFPREKRGNMPSFRHVLKSVVAAWQGNREEITSQAGRIAAALAVGIPAESPPQVLAASDRLVKSLAATSDAEWGGFGGAPKFPQAPVLEFLLKELVLDPSRRLTIAPLLERTLDAMRAGGIYDQVGGGFARYSVDHKWLIPHFEKMLYDNALLARVYLRAGQVLDIPQYTSTATEILDYMADDLRDPAGGIHAAEDADSEGVEGKFYVWSQAEFDSVTGEDATVAGTIYGVTPGGNFEGLNNLHLAASVEEVAEHLSIDPAAVRAAKRRADAALRATRDKRVPPARDDKVIAAWNGLALRAFAEAGAILDDDRYAGTAEEIADFITAEMIDSTGSLARSWRRGRVSGPGFCIDYAAVAVGLFTLYQATGDVRWYETAEQLTLGMIDRFYDNDGFYSTERDDLIARPRDFADNPLPSANSLAVEALMLLEAYTGGHQAGITAAARGAGRLLDRAPQAVASLLGLLRTIEHGVKEVAIVGSPAARRSLERVIWDNFRPDCVLASGDRDDGVPLLAERTAGDAAAAAHVCHKFECDLPVNTAADLRSRLDDGGNSPATAQQT